MKQYAANKIILSLLCFCLGLTGCEKEDSMAADRVVSPVLVTVQGATFTATEPVKVIATVYELDKSGLLNNAVGIDSIRLTNFPLKVKLNNAQIAELTTDAKGQATFQKTWAELGFATPRAGNALTLELAGSHKGQDFIKQARVQVK